MNECKFYIEVNEMLVCIVMEIIYNGVCVWCFWICYSVVVVVVIFYVGYIGVVF